MKKVSFDFDNTLTVIAVERFAQKLIEEGHAVWIVTSRSHAGDKEYNKDLYEVSKRIGDFR